FDPAARLAFLSGETPAPAAPTPDVPAWPAERLTEPAVDAPATFDTPAWLERAAAARAAAVSQPAGETANAIASEPAAEPTAPASVSGIDAAPVVPAADVEPLPPTTEGRAAAGTNRTSDLLRRYRPGQSLDAELAAFEAELDRQEAA